MKSLSAVLLLAITGASSAQVPSSCTVPPQLTSAYERDIAQLTTNYLFQVQSPDTVLVHLPQATVDEVSGGMAAILNAVSIPESDSVFNLYCVHNMNGWPYSYAGFLVGVDTSYTWTQAWQNLVTVTGNSYVDSLTAQYGLHVTNFYNWSFGNYAELGVDSSWNVMALMDSIGYAPGVTSVELNGIIGEAGKIEYHRSGSDCFYDFYFEFNDCFDGCDNYREWNFKVDSACSVYYLGFYDWGAFGISPLPPPLNCNIFDATNEMLLAKPVLFPNPVSNELKIYFSNAEAKLDGVAVYNALGAKLKRKMTSGEKEIAVDVAGLQTGIYWVVITLDGQVYRSSFVKQ